jgi:HSP20 family protein
VSDTLNKAKSEASEKKEDIKVSLNKTKDKASEKTEDLKHGINKTKDKASEKTEDLKHGINKTKDKASEKTEDLKQGFNDFKEDISSEKENLEKESEKEGVTPAEKVLNDIIARFKQGANSFTDYATESGNKKEALVTPLVDVINRNDSITLIIDIPNVNKEDIDIGISKNSVDIEAKFKDEPDDDGNFIQKERNYGTVHRKISLNTEIKVKESKAKYENCTLTIELPKMVEDVTKMNID